MGRCSRFFLQLAVFKRFLDFIVFLLCFQPDFAESGLFFLLSCFFVGCFAWVGILEEVVVVVGG